MKRTFSGILAGLAGATLAFAQSPSAPPPSNDPATTPSGLAPAGGPAPKSDQAVQRTSAAKSANAAAANTDGARARGQTPPAQQRAATAADNASTARAPDVGAREIAPAHTATGKSVKVPSPPPQALMDVQPPSPGPDYAWMAGGYIWKNNQWEWVSGRWEKPPKPTQTWYPGAYDARTQTWTDGYWATDPSPAADATSGTSVNLPAPPEPAR